MSLFVASRNAAVPAATCRISAILLFGFFSQNIAAASSEDAANKGVEKVASVIWDESCDDQGDEAGITITLLGILAPKLIDFALGQVSNSLAETSKEYRVSHIGKAADSWGTALFSAAVESGAGSNEPAVNAQINFEKSCVIVHSGTAGAWGEKIRGSKQTLTAEAERSFYPGSVSRLAQRPALFFMAEIDYMQVGQRGLVFRVVPKKLALNSFTSRGRSSKDIVGTIRFSVPDIVIKGGFTADAVFPPVTSVKAGDRMEFTNLTSDWISFPKLSGNAGDAYNIPASVQVTVLETDTGMGAGLFSSLSDAITKNQKELNKAILESLSKEEK